MMKSMMLALKSKQPPNIVPDVQAQRRGLTEMTQMLPIAPGVSIRSFQIDGIDVELLIPEHYDTSCVLLYLHGGSYTAGSPQTHRSLVSRIVSQSGVQAIVVDYRLAPENPFPAAIQDCSNVYLSILNSKDFGDSIIVGGDSAGGGLALSLVLELKEMDSILPIGLFLLSPWTDLTASGDSVESRSEIDPWLRPSGLGLAAGAYLGGVDPSNSKASPLFSDLSGFPPTLILVGSDEILFDDSSRLHEKLKAAEVPSTLSVGEGLWHVWPAFSMLPESQIAMDKISDFIKSL